MKHEPSPLGNDHAIVLQQQSFYMYSYFKHTAKVDIYS